MQRALRFARDDRGLETVEYAIVAGLIVAGLVALFAALGTWTFKRYKQLGRSVYKA